MRIGETGDERRQKAKGREQQDRKHRKQQAGKIK